MGFKRNNKVNTKADFSKNFSKDHLGLQERIFQIKFLKYILIKKDDQDFKRRYLK